MPRVRLPDGSWYKCSWKTTAAAWRRKQSATLEYETTFKAVFEDALRSVDAQCKASDLPDESFFPTFRNEMLELMQARRQQDQPDDAQAVNLPAPTGAPPVADGAAAMQA